MAVMGVGTPRACRGQHQTMKHTEVHCHACPASTKVAHRDPHDLVQHLEDRKWNTSSGAISCPAHAHVTVMPRHRFGQLRRAS